jgi:hypothetical protein
LGPLRRVREPARGSSSTVLRFQSGPKFRDDVPRCVALSGSSPVAWQQRIASIVRGRAAARLACVASKSQSQRSSFTLTMPPSICTGNVATGS